MIIITIILHWYYADENEYNNQMVQILGNPLNGIYGKS